MKRRNTIAAACLIGLSSVFSPAAAQIPATQPAEQQEQEHKKVKGPEFTMRVSYNGDPGYREIEVDVDNLILVDIPIKDEKGKVIGTKKALAPSVAFIANFDILNSAALQGLSQNQIALIRAAGTNMSVDRQQVAFMLLHVNTAHGVEYDEIKTAAEFAKPYFGLERNLTAEQIAAMHITVIPVKEVTETEPAPSQ